MSSSLQLWKLYSLNTSSTDFPAQIREKLHCYSSELFPSPSVSKSIPSYMKSLINPSLTMTSPSPQPGPPNFLVYKDHHHSYQSPSPLSHPAAHLPSPTSIFGSNSAKFLKVSAYIVFLQVCDCSSWHTSSYILSLPTPSKPPLAGSPILLTFFSL